jgi:hypothetical protein
METIAHDDACDRLDALISELIRNALIVGQHKRLRTLTDLDAATLRLSAVCRRLIDSTADDPSLRSAIYAAIPQEQIADAIT